MFETKRKIKQIFIFLIFLAIFFLVLLAIFLHFRSWPSCYDGKINQGESEIDCGGPCSPCEAMEKIEDLIIEKTEFVHDVDNKYDLVVKIKNPNQKIGAVRINLKFIIKNLNSQTIKEAEATNEFILPRETKYIFISGVFMEETPVEVNVQINEVQWDDSIHSLDPRLVVINKNYQRETSGSAYFSRVNGTLINKSDADFQNIGVKIILRDREEKLLAVNYQVINTLRSGEQRDFNIPFYHSFPDEVEGLEVFPETNIYDPDNFIGSQHFID